MTGNPQICPQILDILTGIPGKPFKFLRNSGIPQYFEPPGSGILHKLQLSFLEILKILGTQFSVVRRRGWIFSEIAHYKRSPVNLVAKVW